MTAPSRGDFEHLSDAVKKLTATLENLPAAMAAIYLRQDVYQADQRTHDKTHNEFDKDIGSLVKFRDWALYTIAGLVLAGLVTLLIAQ